MTKTLRSFFIVIALVLVSSTFALTQTPALVDLPSAIPAPNMDTTILAKESAQGWQVARSATSAGHKILVVTLDQPDRRHSCRIQSFTDDKIVCSRAFDHSRTYLKQQIAALILPGSGADTLRVFLGLNAGLGASIWGTVVLVATCPACAAATAFAALVCLAFAGAIAYTDDVPEKLVFLAPSEHRTAMLRSLVR